MSRPIDDEALKENFPLPCEEWEMKGQQTLWDAREIWETIDRMPTVDAVEVVRCRDCVHYIKHDKRCGIWNHGGIVPYGFCFLGERRADE